jgi:hypothetical protein
LSFFLFITSGSLLLKIAANNLRKKDGSDFVDILVVYKKLFRLSIERKLKVGECFQFYFDSGSAKWMIRWTLLGRTATLVKKMEARGEERISALFCASVCS